MNLTKTVLLALPICLLQSCKETQQEPKAAVTASTKLPEKKNETPEDYRQVMLAPQGDTLEGYVFRYGYTAYDEEDGSNPGYLEVLKGGKVVFKDAFKGEGYINITPLGHHDLDGDKAVFVMQYGIEACDYPSTGRYYVVDGAGKFSFINSYWAATGGDLYASRYYSHIFPTDSLGKPNTLTIVEGMAYHERDQPDVADTTHIVFAGNSFKLDKLSNDLGKE
ncbi:hypothetical protein AM493_11430 [Flavobacterium akiainvivens]|uniref:Uncharacterized protein n=1 Tax=Flavobacterium akiainvivens TaxID=1202724 RepID=A0A0M9VIE9_9FLAO|nr:hypothetical protein [Flavobacterium akiainvivens]KOS06576.1 hypothetical protein AM493_11430 [Flavobacterium akiainvivens]SFQ10115.1 hypothetical protein SAMN05444144_10172 [Flavobacterium akiainvivens]